MADVAKVAGVSSQTVSRVLRDPDCVLPETRDRIMGAIKDLDYVPNLAASNLASSRSSLVGAIIPSISASVFSETVQGLSNVLLPAGYQLLLGHTDYSLSNEEDLIRAFLSRRPDSLFIGGTKHTRRAVSMLRTAGIPVIESWDWLTRPVDSLVGFSNRAAAYDMMRHLVSTRRQRIAFVGIVNSGDYRALEREKGYLAAIRDFGLDRPRGIRLEGKPLSMQSGVEGLECILSKHPDVDAIFFSSDVFAVGAMLECQRRGIDVPGKLAISGFGDFDIAAQFNPSLTTVSIPAYEIGRQSADHLLRRMRKETNESVSIDVGFQIIPRASTRHSTTKARA
jgi:LacI family gluconate utilization system Gnt-I transcriptional repressor